MYKGFEKSRRLDFEVSWQFRWNGATRRSPMWDNSVDRDEKILRGEGSKRRAVSRVEFKGLVDDDT